MYQIPTLAFSGPTMSKSKANSHSTVERQGSIDKRTEYHPETRAFWGHIWVCEACGGRDTRGTSHIEHAADCPNAMEADR
jgi:hypothetical protein